MRLARLGPFITLLTTAAAASACAPPLDADSPKSQSAESANQPAGSPNVATGPATWQLAPGQRIDKDTTEFWALVWLTDCNSGKPFRAVDPSMRFEREELVVTFRATPPPGPGVHTCMAGPPDTYRVELKERLGARSLADGYCRESPGAASTSHCDPTQYRYRVAGALLRAP